MSREIVSRLQRRRLTTVLCAVACVGSGSGGGGTWGSITGTLSAQTDLQAALDAKLAKASNLSDLASASTARTNLGLGTAAQSNSVDFDAAGAATAAQAAAITAAGAYTDTVALQLITNTIDAQTDSFTLSSSQFAVPPAIIELTKTGAATITVPPNASVSIAVGRSVAVLKTGTGDLTYSPGAGVTIIPGNGGYTSVPNQVVILVKKATNTWQLINGVAIDATALGLVPNTRQVAGVALTADITIAQMMAAVGAYNVTILSADVVNNNVTPDTLADVTGLSFAVVSGSTYTFKFRWVYTSAASTTGSRWTISGPTITFLQYDANYDLTATTATLNRAIVAYDGGAVNATTQTAASAVAEGYITGVFKAGASGNIILRFSSEISGSAITCLKDYSFVEWKLLVTKP